MLSIKKWVSHPYHSINKVRYKVNHRVIWSICLPNRCPHPWEDRVYSLYIIYFSIDLDSSSVPLSSLCNCIKSLDKPSDPWTSWKAGMLTDEYLQCLPVPHNITYPAITSLIKITDSWTGKVRLSKGRVLPHPLPHWYFRHTIIVNVRINLSFLGFH